METALGRPGSGKRGSGGELTTVPDVMVWEPLAGGGLLCLHESMQAQETLIFITNITVVRE